MIHSTDCAVDAQSLISISLRKIHNSRTQRGGIKLHKNLLVSYVLRNARQVYMNEKYAEIYRMQQHYEEVMTVCNEIRELDPLEPDDECEETGGASVTTNAGASDCCCGVGVGSESPSLCSALLPVQSCLQAGDETCKPSEPPSPPSPSSLYRSSCCALVESEPESYDFSPAYCNKTTTTVLDLDTHVVTTVENGYLHQDCCASLQQCCPAGGAPSPAKKRKVDFGYYASEVEVEVEQEAVEDVVPDFTPCKRAKFEDCSYVGTELDTSNNSHINSSNSNNISNLISIFGSGFSGLVSRQADLEQTFNGQFCSKQALASIGAWTRAIVAF